MAPPPFGFEGALRRCRGRLPFDVEEHLTTGRVDKAAYRSTLSSMISRSDKSIEYKHCNISAVLTELGLPWLPGYAPLHHYQKLLVEEVERQFGRLSTFAELVSLPKLEVSGLGVDELF